MLNETEILIDELQEHDEKQEKYSSEIMLLLTAHNLNYVSSGYYWQIGTIEKTQGWILHLSVVKIQLLDLLKIILPILHAEKVAFKVVKDLGVASAILEGSLGYINLGKIISIYPEDDSQALLLAKKLLIQTIKFRGPSIPTDRHLGSIIYTRYGSFNPVILKDATGKAEEYIYNRDGQLVPDTYSIPFSIPHGITWPYYEIVGSEIIKPGKLLNGKYYPIKTLKPDVKGHVIKAMYFKSFWQIKACLIKQGKKDILVDDTGRSVQDRLKWQYTLHKDLAGHIPLPEIYEYFEQQEDNYLAMEYFPGISLTQWLNNIYKERHWRDLPLLEKTQLLNTMENVLSIIIRLHEKGYVHRDLTPENILINKKRELCLIDMELTWSSVSHIPDPPFKLGTPGFISPEQMRLDTPTVKEDIYALGAFLLSLFSNMHPTKLQSTVTDKLLQTIMFFTGDSTMAKLISDCMSDNPDTRPELLALTGEIRHYRVSLMDNVLLVLPNHIPLDKENLKLTIQAGINGLSLPTFLSSTGCWRSRPSTQDPYIGNQQTEMAIYNGWHTGLAGVMSILASAKQIGFDIKSCEKYYHLSWKYILSNYFENDKFLQTGLYTGGPGIAIALAKGINAGLLSHNKENISRLNNCFSGEIQDTDLSEGVAGTGIALLFCQSYITKGKFQSQLSDYITRILSTQRKDGSWPVYSKNKKGINTITGLDYGVAGIIWFLLAAYKYSPTPPIKSSIERGLEWLIQSSLKKGGVYNWAVTNNSKSLDVANIGLGTPGIILTFVKAYEILKTPTYKQIVENFLSPIPDQLVGANFTLSDGLCGFAEIYLEASQILDNPIWISRAQYMVDFFSHCAKWVGPDKLYWLTSDSDIPTADLFTGNTGILHFLLRFSNPGNFSHPLWPYI